MILTSVTDPRLEPGDMLLRLSAATICGTDIRILRGHKTKDVRYPAILGHEFVGEIVEAGSHAQFRMGDKVCVCPAIACGKCVPCLSGAENICSALTAFGYELDGAFAELIRIPALAVHNGNVLPLPDGMDPAIAAMAEPLACVINGQDSAGVSAGQTVVVLGAGPIGLLHVMLAKHRGAARIIVGQRSSHRRAAAVAAGADAAIDPRTDALVETVRDATGGRGADTVIVAVGSEELANLALRLVRKRGAVNLFAGFPAGAVPAFDLNAVHYGELVVTGAFGLTRKQFGEALRLIATNSIPAAGLLSHRFPLSDIMAAFATAEQGSALKVAVINP